MNINTTKLLTLLIMIPLKAFSANLLETIEVKENLILKEKSPHWREQDKTNIYSAKKNRSTKIEYLPPVQTDNNRQHFSQQASIYAPDQSTEPWTALSFRGIGDPHEGQNILILQDGLPVPVDMYGQPGNYYAPPAPLMNEIQVVAGGGALMFGPQPGGAINYISPRLTENMETSGRLNISAGSYNLLSTVNSISGSSGKTSYWAGFYRKQGDGYQRENADFYADHLQLKTNTFLEGNSIFKFALQGYDSDFGMPGGMSKNPGTNRNVWGEDNRKATRNHDRLKISRALMMVGLEKKINSQTDIDFQLWSTAYKRYSKTQAGSAGTFSTTNTNAIRTDNSYGLNAEMRLSHHWEKWEKNHTLSMGYLSYNSNSPKVTEAGNDAAANHGDVTNRSLRTTRANSVFIENRFNFGKLMVVPGVRFENITLDNRNRTDNEFRQDTYNVILGGVGASYDLTPQTQLFTNVSQGFKPISYADVLSLGDPNVTVQGDINPSYNYIYEAGIRGETLKVNWDSSLYLIQRQNLISRTGNVISNGKSAQYQGIESSVTLKDILPTIEFHELDLFANVNFVNAKFNGGQTEGKTPAYVPSVILKYGLVYHIQKKIHASLLGTFVNEHYADDGHSDDNKIPSYSVYDLLAEYTLNHHWSVNGAINNLLDEQYYSRVRSDGILPTMGRNMYIGASYKF